MRIGENNRITGENPDKNPTPASRTSAQTASASTRDVGATSVLGKDRAELLLDSTKVQNLIAKVNGFPEIRKDKVQAIREGLRTGKYQVSSHQTADALISQLQRGAA